MQIRDWINRGVWLGLLVSVLLCLVGAGIGAWLMDREVLAESSQGVWMAAVWLHAAFFGCRIALRSANEKRLLHAAAQAFALYFIVWAAALAVSAVPNFAANGWYITGCIWGGAALAAILPAGKKRRKKRAAGKRGGRKSGRK